MYGDPKIPLTSSWVIMPRSHRLDRFVTIRDHTLYCPDSGELHMESRNSTEADVPIGDLLNLRQEQRNQHCSYESAVKIPYIYTKMQKGIAEETPCTALAIWDDGKQMWRLDDEERPAFYVEIVRVVPDQ